MNAAHPISPLNKFKWLLKREYWENKGGFFWAPLIASAISLTLAVLAIVAGLFAVRRAAANGDLHVNGVNVNGLDVKMLTAQMTPHDMVQWANGMDFTLVVSSAWPFLVLGFVAFFYCLGALYDDRRDRSVLFWKSMPISDVQTVLSKVVSALIVAPLFAVVIGIVAMFVFGAIISLVLLAHGGNPMQLIWGPASPLTIVAGMISWIPVYALWALPTAGWLLMCSAWAKSKPFLWAVILPLFAGIIVSSLQFTKIAAVDGSWFWANVVGRLLLGFVPGIEMAYKAESPQDESLQSVLSGFTPADQFASLAEPQLWIGAVVGVVFIVAAIWLRKRRDEI